MYDSFLHYHTLISHETHFHKNIALHFYLCILLSFAFYENCGDYSTYFMSVTRTFTKLLITDFYKNFNFKIASDILFTFMGQICFEVANLIVQ